MNNYFYTGHEKDYETGLTYMLARYYSQGYGRFLSPDPGYDYDQLDPMSWNLYSYVRGNPVAFVDPTGRTIEVTSLTEKERNKLIKELERLANYKSKKKFKIITEEKNGRVFLKFQNFDSSKANNVAKDLNKVMEDVKKNVQVVARNGSSKVFWMQANVKTHTITIDFQDRFPGCYTQGMGMIFMHELLHAYNGLRDPAKFEAFMTGETVDYVNEHYRYPLGLSIRLSYPPIKEEKTGRKYLPFSNLKNSKIGEVIKLYIDNYK